MDKQASAQSPSVKNKIVAAEEAVLNFWQRARIFEQSVVKEAPQGDYVFYDGPPFATGTPHYGHLVSSIMKDVVPRYFTMNGYKVERKWGWDCHGLPIENIVEKELGTKRKKDIEELGVEKFNDLCRSKVLTYADEWEKVVARLGRWVDMKNPYRTMDLGFMESVWWVFKELWDKGLIYEAHRSMHICPRCETTLSQSEVTEGYRDIKDLSAIAKFELVDEPGTFVLAWTTTPWTLIGNVALAIGNGIEYVKVKLEGGVLNAFDKKPGEKVVIQPTTETEYYIIAKERLADVFKDKQVEIISTFIGADLIGRAYKPLFDYYSTDEKLENRANGWKVYAADFVTTEEGTGVVHIAPAFGEDDMRLGREQNLPFIQHVGLDGHFAPEVSDFPNLHVKPLDDHMATDIEIIKYLAAGGLLFHKEKYEHSYPHCWRCDTPLINYATSSWFVNVTKIKDKLLETAKDITWSPEHMKEGRFGNWLEGARDWSISRQRFWASAIPIWQCACGEKRVIGSVAELTELSGIKLTDIHKDKVDPIVFPCAKCNGEMRRIPDVLDCWFESGSMPYAQHHYPFENKEKVENNFPAKFIAEGVDQTRAWFYYLHVIAGGLRASHAYENVIANGIVLAEDGKKMSKRLQNYPDPVLMLDKYGADALRMQLLASPVMAAENINFSEKGTEESLRKNLMLLMNIFNFYELYAQENKELDLSGPALRALIEKSDNVLDKWIIAKFDLLLETVKVGMENYNLPKAVRPITVFIDEFSTWYLRRSRDRFKSEDKNDRQLALLTTKTILLELSKVIAPFMPFAAEYLWQKLSGYDFSDDNHSVHLENWPVAFAIEPGDIMGRMTFVCRIVEAGLMKRNEAGIKIRQRLNKITVKYKITKLAEEYQVLVKDELNINELEILPAENDEIFAVELDTEITPALRQEGIKREIIRSVNMLRKEAGLSLGDRTKIMLLVDSEEIKTMISALAEEIKKETLSDDLEFVSDFGKDANIKEIKIEKEKICLSLKK